MKWFLQWFVDEFPLSAVPFLLLGIGAAGLGAWLIQVGLVGSCK